MCPLCKRAQKNDGPAKGKGRKCAFKDGLFITDNHKCATIEYLQNIAEHHGVADSDKEGNNIAALRHSNSNRLNLKAGWIVMHWYKSHSRMRWAVFMRDASRDGLWHSHEMIPHPEPQLLTLKRAEEAINWWKNIV
jgi:hypothetical protein